MREYFGPVGFGDVVIRGVCAPNRRRAALVASGCYACWGRRVGVSGAAIGGCCLRPNLKTMRNGRSRNNFERTWKGRGSRQRGREDPSVLCLFLVSPTHCPSFRFHWTGTGTGIYSHRHSHDGLSVAEHGHTPQATSHSRVWSAP